MKKLKLFCLPYAGGTARVYQQWKKYLNLMITLYPIELSGRGDRFGTPLYNTFEEAVEDIYTILKEKIDEEPYIIFGHSMGSILAVQLAHRIQENNLPNPKLIIASGCLPPHLREQKKTIHNLPLEEFMQEIYKLGGLPNEIIETKELFEIFSEILLADVRMLECFKVKEKIDKLRCPIIAFRGHEDIETPEEKMKEWELYTSNSFKQYCFKGQHFFIIDNMKNVVGIINQIIDSL